MSYGLTSVIIPVFNGAELLGEQLSALARQDYLGDWECVVADNGSTDESRDVALRFAEKLPLKVVDATERRGNAAARNLGVKHASGDVLLFADQDDVVGEKWLSSHVSALRGADISVGPFEMTSGQARAGVTRVDAPMFGTYHFLPYGLSSNMAMTRRLYESLGGFSEEYPAACDVDFCWRAQIAGFTLTGADEAVVVKRRRATAHGVWRQHFVFGTDDVRLFATFGDDGMPRSWRSIYRPYGWLVLHIFDLLRADRRLAWIGVAAQRAGRFTGSLTLRRCYL